MDQSLTRRKAIGQVSAVGGLCLAAPALAKKISPPKLITKKIPKSGEVIPVIGMGTWITFNVGGSKKLMDDRSKILEHFFKRGGGVIDSSPMYGSAQQAVGYALKKLSYPKGLFSADKIWTSSTSEGKEQFEKMKKLWGLAKFDLIQVHNLLNWESHLKTLKQMKKAGRVKNIGITTSHGRRHSDLIAIMKNEPIDFVQATYNLVDREVEDKILPLAKERKIAFIANRPLDGGALFDRVGRKSVPSWTSSFDAKVWSQFFLKFVVSHPAVTCAIPATSQLEHMKENMEACYGKLPDAKVRNKMIEIFSA